jgi:hypothetical protein
VVGAKKRTRRGRTAGIVVGTLLVLIGISAAGVALYASRRPAKTHLEPPASELLGHPSTESPPASSAPLPSRTTEASRSTDTIGPPGPIPLDAAEARILVDRFLRATQANDAAAAKALITATALKKYGGPTNLKVKGIVTSWTIDSVDAVAERYAVSVSVQTVSGPEQFRYTVGRDHGVIRIVDFQAAVQ